MMTAGRREKAFLEYHCLICKDQEVAGRLEYRRPGHKKCGIKLQVMEAAVAEVVNSMVDDVVQKDQQHRQTKGALNEGDAGIEERSISAPQPEIPEEIAAPTLSAKDTSESAEDAVEHKPDVTAEAEPAVTAEATPEVNTEATPEVTAEAKTAVTAEGTPEVTAESKPEVTAEANPGATKEEYDISTKGLDAEQERLLVQSTIQELVESVTQQASAAAAQELKSTPAPVPAIGNYTWTQNSETVQISVPVEDSVRGKDVKVALNHSEKKLLVQQREGSKVLEGTLWGDVEEGSELAWQLEENDSGKTVTVELEKASKKHWLELFNEPAPVEAAADPESNAEPDVPESPEQIIELDTRSMPKRSHELDEDNDLRDEMADVMEEEELLRELEREIAEANNADDRIASDASVSNGELPLEELLQYYKSIALGKTDGAQSVDMAAMQVAMFYSRGIVVEQNFTEAAKWYELAAENGNNVAMFHLGLLCQEGLGMEGGVPDVKKAMDWWDKAAKAGNANAMYNLGVMYINGHGVPSDPVMALNYFKSAKELDPSLPVPPLPPFSGGMDAVDSQPAKPLTAEEKARQREASIQNLRYLFWTTTTLSVVVITFFGVRYWMRNRL